MADTLPNIRIPANTWVNLYQLSGILVGTAIVVENISVRDILLTVSRDEPAAPVINSIGAFNILKRNGDKLRNSLNDTGAWAYCTNSEARVSVREL